MGEQKKMPELLLKVMLAVVQVLASRGIEKSAATVLGCEIAEFMSKNYGGSNFYLPKGVSLESAKKAAQIYAEFRDGASCRELVEKYGFTEVWVRELVKRGKKAERK